MRDRLITIVLSIAATYGFMKSGPEPVKELVVDQLIVRKELIVSDTGVPWEKGYEAHQIPRGVYARALGDGPGGLWVRSRLIKGEIDDPFGSDPETYRRIYDQIEKRVSKLAAELRKKEKK